jgi:hypothetical protein
MVMAETLFTFLVVTAVTLLLWWPRPPRQASLAAGLLAGYAITVRSAGLPLPLVLLGYLAVRRAGWRRAAAMAAGCAAPVAAYAIWFHAFAGQYALTRSDGFWFAAEVDGGLPGGPLSAANDRLLRDFAFRAILAQPVAYLHTITDGLVLAVDWRRYPYPSPSIASGYYFHLRPQTLPANRYWIPGGTPASDARAYGHASPSRVIEPAATLIAGYQRVFFTDGPLFAVIIVAGLGGMVRFRRQRGGPGMLPWTAAVALLIFPIAAADFSYRYLLPVLPLACLAAGLASAPRRRSCNVFPADSSSLPGQLDHASTTNQKYPRPA